MSVVVVEVLHGFLLLPTLLVKKVSGNVMEVDELDTCLFDHLTIPLAVCIVAAFNLAIGPLVTRCQRYQDGGSPLLTNILNKLLEIPAKRLDHLV